MPPLPIAIEPLPVAAPPRRAGLRFMLSHPAHLIALGFGAGLAPWAPGTVGTLWAWLSFVLFRPYLSDATCAWILLAALLVGWWCSTVTARHLRIADPGVIVWDEVLAFWLVLWLVMPTGLLGQTIAFVLFRVFDAAKPGPIGWADRCFKLQPGQTIGWAQGFGVLFDDLLAAGCTLLVIAWWRWW